MSAAGGVEHARLGVVDEIFLRGHRGLGTPNVLQGLWRTADPVDPGLLHRLHAALRTGELGRRVVRSRVPGARPSWRRNVRAHPLLLASRPLTPAQALTWAAGLGGDLDPEAGPGWRLAATPLVDGGTVIALTCSHVLADARGLVHAANLALAGVGGQDGAVCPPTPSASPPAGPPPEFADPSACPPASAGPGSDWADAARQWSIVLGGTARALTHRVRSRAAHAHRTAPAVGASFGDTVPPPGISTVPPPGISAARDARAAAVRAESARRHRTDPLPVHSIAASCDATEWDRIARERGGTANSLFIHLVAETLRTAGALGRFDWAGIEASLPVDLRDTPRVTNAIAVTSVVVEPDDDPATLRAKARASYERRMTAPAGVPEEILQVVGDRLAHLMAAGAGERDILCSNIGDLPQRLLTFGPHRCLGVAARAIHPGLTVGARPRTRLSGYLCRIGARYTLCLVALDPPGIESAEELAEITGRVAAGLAVPLTFW
ncbi:hypothetical protein [Nocardia farcinica]|uniref:hypothetical protein n=1 Tax=Nocardia farcinica TaxID=37329 RepID=UPI002454585E|nr:hypothetical protein [Nocardia farcinica]